MQRRTSILLFILGASCLTFALLLWIIGIGSSGFTGPSWMSYLQSVLFYVGVVLALWPLVARTSHGAERRLREKMIEQGRCPFCGYWLTGIGDRPCPECGRNWREQDTENPSS